MDEAGRKRKLVAAINATPGGYARRLEDRFAVGLLDLIIKLPGHPWIWAEGKIFDGLQFEPSERQWIEGNRILATGTPVLLLGWKKSSLFISPWVKKARVDDCYRGDGPNLLTLQSYLKVIHESR